MSDIPRPGRHIGTTDEAAQQVRDCIAAGLPIEEGLTLRVATDQIIGARWKVAVSDDHRIQIAIGGYVYPADPLGGPSA